MNDISNPLETIFKNRGVDDVDTYMNLNDGVLHDYHLLDNIREATQCLLKHIENKSDIHIIVDCDPDGYTSAAILYQYLKLLDSNVNLTYSIHTGKQHGLSDDIVVPDNANLLLMPDAGSNDVVQCGLLKEKGVDVIILDHHEYDGYNHNAIVVNNQSCEYPNKSLSGVGVTYKFLQAIDDETWNNYSKNFIDLVALGNIADSMDIRSYETKRLIDIGINKIRNKLFKALIDKQSYSMNGVVDITNIQFYIVPLINGLIRAGDSEEKDMLFRAFIEHDEIFSYKKRGEEIESDETIYDRVARLCGNAKSRQNNSKDKAMIIIDEVVKNKKLNNNKIMFIDVTDILNPNLTGVTAIKIAEKYKKPCLLLRIREDKTTDEYKVFGGSGRNIDNSPINDLRGFLDELGTFEMVQGHSNAFGFEIKEDNILKTLKLINTKLKDIDYSGYYEVDFIIDADELPIALIKDIDSIKHYFGTGIGEPKIAIQNLTLHRDQMFLMGKNCDTWKFTSDEGMAFVKFRCKEDDKVLNWFNNSETGSIIIDLVGTANINNYKGILTPQIIIADYNEV